jgi:hypothetical protein
MISTSSGRLVGACKVTLSPTMRETLSQQKPLIRYQRVVSENPRPLVRVRAIIVGCDT